MNTTTYHATKEAGRKRKLSDGLGAILVAGLLAVAAMSTAAQAQNPPQQLSDVTTALLDKSGNPMTLAQMAYQFARGLTPPFLGTREADAISWLMGNQVGEQPGHQPPLSPLGGWGNPGRNATVGDLTVLLVQQYKIEPTAAAGGQLTAQDYQNALVGFTGSASVSTFSSMASIFSDWTTPTINVLGPQPSSGEQTRSTPTP
ncbi:MAG: hypothetical protein HZC54_07200 [Verrucomicrobia bacterium]|nr:hypothetical protein [Verrucomicrobiota bacterium]